MGIQEQAGSHLTTQDENLYCRALEQEVEKLQHMNEEMVRLNNIEKFAAAGHMARTIAHEVRNPLTNISLALEQLNAEMQHNDETALLIDMINRNTLRINQMITDLLNSTKFAQLSFTRASLQEVLQNAVSNTHTYAHQKGASVIGEYADDIPPLMIDTEKLVVAFENVLLHAIESVKQDEGFIRINALLQNDKCLITISDNGTGLSEDKIQRLFEPYFASKLKGSELALTYAQNVILNHGGNIYAESEPGKGTAFTIVLQVG